MNLQLVLGDVAYGLDTEDASITAQKDVAKLKPGSHIFLLDGKEVMEADTNLADKEFVQLFVGLTNAPGVVGMPTVLSSVPIRRKSVLYIDHEAYKAPVTEVVEIDFASIADNAVGEGNLVLSDHSYNRTIKNDKIMISYSKKATVTRAVMLSRLVEKINGHNATYPVATSFVTASTTGTKLVLTMKSQHTDFSVAMSDLFEGLNPVTTRQPVISLTDAIDILKTEREYSGNLGNGNYATLGEAYWSFPQQTNLATQYDVFSIKFQGNHDLPQNRVRSAVMWLKIAVPTTQAAAFKASLQKLFGDAFDKATGEDVPSAERANETDGNPAT